jgi:uncharacterized membrane protein
VPFLRFSVAVAIWDATVATAAYFLVLPLLAMVLGSAWPLIGYAIDVPVLLVPVLAGAIPRREVRKAIASLPGFFCLRLLNSLYFLEAVWSEVVRGRRFAVYEKGH